MSGIPWVIFDADNTLWPIEHLYNNARTELCDLVASHGSDRQAADAFQRQRDATLHATYGYSACRFARSFEDTWLNFFPSAATAEMRHARQLALEVFEKLASPSEGLELVLDALLAANYHLGIITAGERWVQERRLNDFHLRDRFAAVEIVESKTAEVFNGFCDKHQVAKPVSWVVGDSLKSDVYPALAAGLRAVWLKVENWREREQSQEPPPPQDLPIIDALGELPKKIGLG